MIETPAGILNSAEIAATGREREGRLDGFVLGLNDLRKETGVPAEVGRTYLVPWMMQAVLAARANGLKVIDSVFNDFRNAEAFASECAQGRAMGFDGKMLIHPAQIDPANEAFAPSPEAVSQAKAIIAAFADPAAQDLNVITIDGQMVERLHLEQAERLLAKAQEFKQNATLPPFSIALDDSAEPT